MGIRGLRGVEIEHAGPPHLGLLWLDRRLRDVLRPAFDVTSVLGRLGRLARLEVALGEPRGSLRGLPGALPGPRHGRAKSGTANGRPRPTLSTWRNRTGLLGACSRAPELQRAVGQDGRRTRRARRVDQRVGAQVGPRALRQERVEPPGVERVGRRAARRPPTTRSSATDKGYLRYMIQEKKIHTEPRMADLCAALALRHGHPRPLRGRARRHDHAARRGARRARARRAGAYAHDAARPSRQASRRRDRHVGAPGVVSRAPRGKKGGGGK